MTAVATLCQRCDIQTVKSTDGPPPRATSVGDYAETLAGYLLLHSEEHLYRASQLSQECIESGLGPEDIIALHFESLATVSSGYSYREQARASFDAQEFLLEVMIAYGVKYKEYLEIKLQETVRDAETRSARDRERILQVERIQREKDELLAAIAHDLRTPLTAAKGNLDLVARYLSRGEMASLEPYIARAKEALERLSRLSADLVEASRGDLPVLARVSCDLRPTVRQACDWATLAAVPKEVSLHFAEPTEPVIASVDPDALLSALGNLLSNAVRYTPPSGSVTVSLGQDGGTTWVTVADTGIGMPPEVQRRIFQKFYRAPEARELEAKGLGLGLALVQQVVTAHNGQIEVQSVPGQGSTFRVILASEQESSGEEGVHDGRS